MAAIGVAQFQRFGDFEKKALRHLNVAALLKPCVPCEPDTRECGDLLAPEPRRASPASGRQPDIGWGECFPVARDELGEVASIACEGSARHDYHF